MKKTLLNIIALTTSMSILGASCSKNGSLRTAGSRAKEKSFNNTSYFPYKIDEPKDSIIAIGFNQTAYGYYLKLSDRKSVKNLKILQQARKKYELVFIKTDSADTHKIIEVVQAPTELTKLFQKSLLK